MKKPEPFSCLPYQQFPSEKKHDIYFGNEKIYAQYRYCSALVHGLLMILTHQFLTKLTPSNYTISGDSTTSQMLIWLHLAVFVNFVLPLLEWGIKRNLVNMAQLKMITQEQCIFVSKIVQSKVNKVNS